MNLVLRNKHDILVKFETYDYEVYDIMLVAQPNGSYRQKVKNAKVTYTVNGNEYTFEFNTRHLTSIMASLDFYPHDMIKVHNFIFDEDALVKSRQVDNV